MDKKENTLTVSVQISIIGPEDPMKKLTEFARSGSQGLSWFVELTTMTWWKKCTSSRNAQRVSFCRSYVLPSHRGLV